MTFPRILIWTGLVAAGAGSLWLWQQRLAQRLIAAETQAVDQTRELERLRTRRSELAREGDALGAARAARLAERPAAPAARLASTARANLRILAEVSRDAVIKLNLPFTNSQTGEIAPVFFELMAINADERSAFMAAWTRAQDRIAEGVAANTQVEKGNDGTLTFRIGSFAEGVAIYEELRQSIESTFGLEGGEAFATLFDQEMSQELAQFGLEERVMVLTPTGVGANGIQRYSLRETRTSFVEAKPGGRQVMATPRNGPLQKFRTRSFSGIGVTLEDFPRKYPALAKVAMPAN